MEPTSTEIRQPVQVERKASALKAKAKEIVKKAIPEKTRQWLIEAGKKLQQKEGRKAIEILSGPPPTTLKANETKETPEQNITEVTPTSEVQQLTETVVKQQPEQTTEQKKGLASRLIETKASAQDHAQKAIQLFNLRVAETEVKELHGNITPEDARNQLEVLAKDESITSAEFISRSKQAFQIYAQVKDQATLEETALQEQFNIRGKINEKIRELDRTKGIKKITAALEKRRLEGQKAVTQRQIDLLRPEVDAKQQLINQITEQEKPIRLKQEEIILAEIGHEIQAIRTEYEKLLQEVIQDDTVTSEIRDAYIQQVISPEVDDKEKPFSFLQPTDQQKDRFYSALRNYLDHREEPEAQRQPYKQELDSFMTKEEGIFFDFWRIEDCCEPLLNGEDKLIVQELVAKMAADDIAPIKAAVEPQLGSYDQINKFSTIFNKAIEPSDIWRNRNENSFGSQILTELDRHITKRFPDMQFWQAMKSSKTANEVFGEIIRQQDQEYYVTALDKSLSDTNGEYIDLLYYYPNPDTIRNLVVISAADPSGYRTIHSNGSLTKLAKRSDWPQILDEAEEKYPTLKKTRPVLEHWNYGENFNQPDIREVVNDFTFGIFSEEGNNPRLTVIASEALANSSMLDVLVSRNEITGAEAESMKSAQEKTKIMWNDQNLKDQDIQISDYNLGAEIKNSCRPLMEKQIKEPQIENNINRLKHLAVLSQEIIDCQDPKIINILSDDSVVKLVSGCRLSGEKSILFVRALTKLTSEGITSLNPLSDLILGEGIFQSENKNNFAIKLISRAMSKQIDETIKQINPENPSLKVDDKNWQSLLSAYIIIQTNNYDAGYISQQARELIPALFQNDEVKDFCLNKLNGLWHDYLTNGTPGIVPLSLSMVPELIGFCHGAGPLSQIESLGLMIKAVNQADIQQTTAERTKGELFTGLRQIENRFTKEKWSNKDRSDFYNISRDIINTSPSIFSDFLTLSQNLNPSEIRRFSKDLYPLYRAKLALIEQIDKSTGVKTYTKEQLMALRINVRGFTDLLTKTDKPFEIQKTKLLEEIRSVFQERFGIIKIPESLSLEHMRSVTNVSTYLANLHGRTPEKETILGFYLSLMVNNRWDDYRKGLEVNPDELLVPEKSEFIKKFLQERQRLNPLTPENVGIQPEEMPEFFKLLQQETSNVVIGNIETIDVKLTNIILNLRGLEDLDLYTDQLDKQRMGLLLDFGNKKIGSVVARMYQQLANPAKVAQFSDEETQIQTRISQIMQERGLAVNLQTLKEHFQDGIRPLSTVVNLMNFIEEARAEPEIESLKGLLEPSVEVIEIFKRLGEDFKPTSGAMALSQDLSYLDNLVVKREDELKPEEKVLITKYTAKIRDQVVKLENIYGQIKNKVSVLRQGGSTSTNPLLQEKLDQIDRIINAQVTQQAITSTTTGNLNTIIENIRECLSCTKEGCNNDTDLTFGDMNKFYLYSQTDTQQKGSVADELVFVEPVTRADGSHEISIIIDKLYDMNTPVILGNQIEAVMKKLRIVKQRFPKIKLSVFVSDIAIQTGGTSHELLLEMYKSQNILANKETIEVDVAESATGDHYIEFGGGARTAGKRQASGIFLSI